MCGICGAAWTELRHALNPGQLEAMMNRLVHRGPDDAASHFDPNAALGFRRLSIIDLAGGRQPLANEDQTIWTVFNGEIYNFHTLRRRLEARGHILRSKGDSEVIVHLFEDEGASMLTHLRGMFALAVWDAPRRTLLLARDRMGQKPLVYYQSAGRIAFASELKALLALPESDLPRKIDPVALDLYLSLGYIPAPYTILEGVKKLPPAHFAIWREGQFEIERYWQPDWNLERARPPREEIEELRATLDDAVREQMIADVPLGAFLSGGIDSSIIVALMQRASSRPVKTFSIGFPDPRYDETHYAELVARQLGTEHETHRVEPRAWETLPDLAWHFDEPFADSSALPTWHVAQVTRRSVTVALTGDAGDELFGGYDRYRALALTELFVRAPEGARRLVRKALSAFLGRSAPPKSIRRRLARLIENSDQPYRTRYRGWMQSFDDEERAALYSPQQRSELARIQSAADNELCTPRALLDWAFGSAAARDPVTQAMVADLLMYLPGDLLVKVDIASMAHGLECRGPFLDHRVVELAAAIPLRRKLHPVSGRSKIVLKEAFADFLPQAVKRRAKMGFGVPLSNWFRRDLRRELEHVLLDPICLGRGLFEPGQIERLVHDHISGAREHAHKLWTLLMLELWFRTHLDSSTPRAAIPARADDVQGSHVT